MSNQTELAALVEPLLRELVAGKSRKAKVETWVPKKVVDPASDGRRAGQRAAEIFRRALEAN